MGFDLALYLSTHEHGKATTIATALITDYTYEKYLFYFDVRPRLQVKLQYHHVGLLLGYSFGLINYYGRLVGANPKAFANVARVGFFYRLSFTRKQNH